MKNHDLVTIIESLNMRDPAGFARADLEDNAIELSMPPTDTDSGTPADRQDAKAHWLSQRMTSAELDELMDSLGIED